MTNQEIKFTVIIPTRERADTLKWALKTCITQDYGNLEIIVSDNFSQDDTREVVQSFKDKRIKYVNTGKRISMSSNWEFALSFVTEGWVTIIGDDDGLLPGALKKVAEIIKLTGIQAIRSMTCSYVWPSLLGKNFGRLGVPLGSGYEIRKSCEWLSKVIQHDTHYSELPMLYNGGFISFEVLREIKKCTNAFYLSCVPDVYSSVSIASVIDTYVYSYEPFAINGASAHSTGTSAFSNDPNSKSSPNEKFKNEGNIPFHKDIPLISNGNYPPSLEILVYESYLQSKALRNSRIDIHSEQLEKILSTYPRKNKEIIIEWAKEFAEYQKIDFNLILKKANRKRIFIKLFRLISRLIHILNMYKIGSPDLPIKDVYEASIKANIVRRVKPSIIENILRLVNERLKSTKPKVKTY